MSLKILFIQTGGTIDKDYPTGKKGWAFEIGEPSVQRVLDVLNPSFDYRILELLKKDSLEIDDRDREKLRIAIINHAFTRIIVTHGTDTMIDTASYLANTLQEKIVVITGATKPERFKDSEASINIGAAIGAVQSLENGVYISMHGIIKKWNEIHQDSNGKYS